MEIEVVYQGPGYRRTKARHLDRSNNYLILMMRAQALVLLKRPQWNLL